MMKSTGQVVSENLGITVGARKDAELERVLMNIDYDNMLGLKPVEVRRNVYEFKSLQPKTEEEKECAELLVRSGLAMHHPLYPHLYILTVDGKVQAFDVDLDRAHQKQPYRCSGWF